MALIGDEEAGDLEKSGFAGQTVAAAYGQEEEESSQPAERSLLDDLQDLLDDGMTYLEAEMSYQKSRASFVSDRLKKTILFSLVALVLGFISLIGLVVGLIIALTPHITGWGATAVVVGMMVIIIALLLRAAAKNWRGLMGVVKPREEEEPDNG